MPTKVTDAILPTTMIGSYPKPRWFEKYNVEGRDLLEWWKLEENFQAWRDATNACITDQEEAGLDIVTDGQMHFDQYGGAIGSFVWYWYERLGGFSKAKLPNPHRAGHRGVRRRVRPQPGRVDARLGRHRGHRRREPRDPRRGWARCTRSRAALTDKPLKVSVGAGPPNLTYHVDLKVPGLALRLAAAARRGPRADLQRGPQGPRGARRGLHPDRGPRRLDARVGRRRTAGSSTCSTPGSTASTRRSPGTAASAPGYGNTFRSVEDALPRVLERWQAVNVEQFALDFALRDMVDVQRARRSSTPTARCRSASSTSARSTSRPTTRSSSGSTRCSSTSSRSGCTSRPTAG